MDTGAVLKHTEVIPIMTNTLTRVMASYLRNFKRDRWTKLCQVAKYLSPHKSICLFFGLIKSKLKINVFVLDDDSIVLTLLMFSCLEQYSLDC